jgi:hypothetical protein
MTVEWPPWKITITACHSAKAQSPPRVSQTELPWKPRRVESSCSATCAATI